MTNSNHVNSYAGSAMSLASGLTFGGLLVYGAVRMSADPKNFLFPLGESFTLVIVNWHKTLGLLCDC